MTSCVLSCAPFAFGKGSTLKGKNLLPGVSKFFPFKVDPLRSFESTVLLVIAIMVYFSFHWRFVSPTFSARNEKDNICYSDFVVVKS